MNTATAIVEKSTPKRFSVFQSLNWHNSALLARKNTSNRTLLLGLSIAMSMLFSQHIFAQSPGCVPTTNMGLWVKADNAGTGAWKDHSPKLNDVEKVGSPTLQTGDALHNFQPYYTGFSGLNYFRDATSSLNSNNSIAQTVTNTTVFAVVRPSSASATGRVVGIDNDAFFAAEPGFSLKNGKPYFYKYSKAALGVDIVSRSHTSAAMANQNSVLSWNTNNASSNLGIGLNGNVTNFTNSGFGIVGQNLLIGSSSGWDTPGPLEGDIQEVIWYNTSLTATDVQKINSYLAIKYGATLTTNYLDGTGATIYNVATYGNNIFGIGNEVCQGLAQNQSRSSNVGFQPIISTTGFAATNASNTTALTDKTYLISGSDAGAAILGTPFVFGGMNNRMTRIWQVTETGAVGTVKVAILKSEFNATVPTLIRSTDATITGTDELKAMTLETIGGVDYYTTTIDFASGDFYTFGGYIIAPGCVVANLKAWYKADAGVTGTTAVTRWADQASGYDVIQETTGQTPSLQAADKSSNYNPYLKFDGLNDHLEYKKERFMTVTSSGSVFGAGSNEINNGGYENFADFGIDNPHMGIFNSTFMMWMNGSVAPGPQVNHLTPIVKNQNQVYGWNWTGGTDGGGQLRLDGNAQDFAGMDFNLVGNGGTVDGMFTIGAWEAVENWKGKIYEVVVYDRNLSPTEKQKIDSYLAIKYGSTIALDYLSGDGTKVWDRTLNTGYNNDITGIGRDECQQLLQKQSTSTESGSVLTMSLGSIAATNAANTGTFAADKNFEIVGDNGLAASYGVTYSPNSYTPVGGYFRMNRIWKVQETGTIGAITVAVPQGKHLLVSTDPTFASGVTEVALTADANGNMTTSHNFSSGDYFTFGNEAYAPGCVAANLKLWLKADVGTTLSGSKVSGWANQSTGTALSVVQATAIRQPEFVTNGMNFNPVLDFTGGQALTAATGGQLVLPATNSPATMVSVSTNRGTSAAWRSLISYGGPGDYPSLHWYGEQPSVYIDLTTTVHSLHTASLPLNTPYIFDGSTNNDNPKDVKLSYNGVTSTRQTFAGADGTFPTGTNSNPLVIGAETDLAGEALDGYLSEAITYDRVLTDAELQRVNTYLAIKYGITLTDSYLSGAGTAIWDKTANTTYHNNVFGIGRDDCQLLVQKQSKSENDNGLVTISLAKIATTNTLNTGSFSVDKSFEIIGDNGLSDSYATAYAPTTYTPIGSYSRMARVWKVQETGTVGTVTVGIPAGKHLLVSNDPTFATGVTEKLLTNDGNGNMTATFDFTSSNQYFTFGDEKLAPGCVTAGLQYWYDAGVSVTGASSVTTWKDRNNNFSLSKNNTGTVTLSSGDAKSNFNPYVLFPSNAHMTGVVDPVALGRLHTSFVVAQKDANIDGIYNHAFRFGAGAGSAVTHDFGIGTALNGGNHQPVHHWLSKGSTINRWNTAYNVSFGDVGLYGGRITAITGTGNKDVSFNGNTVTYSDNIIGNINANMQIGGSVFGMQGRIPEVVYYNVALSTLDREKVDSYMGIKYGLTLDHDYYSGAGIKVWDKTANATYHNHVFGIARDDCQGLHQRQSNSVLENMIAVGIDNNIATTNLTNTGAFNKNKAFLMIGDNNVAEGDLTTLTSGDCTPESVDKVTSRIWQVVETDSVESVKVSVDLSAYGFSANYPVYMQVSSTAGFASYSNVIMTKVGANYEANYDFNGTKFFRFAGNTNPPANACTGDKIYEWNTFPTFWTWGQTSRTTTIGDQTFTVTISDPNSVIYAPTVYPVGQFWQNHIFIPRYDANGTNNKITTKIVMSKPAYKASFEIFDMDEYYGKDVVRVYGKLAGSTVNPKFTFPSTTALSANGNKVSATTGVWDISARGRVFVNFNSAVDEIYVEYTKDNGWFFKSYQDIRIKNIDITCKPFVPEEPVADNVYIAKQVATSNPKIDEAFTYKFIVKNLDCEDKTINFTDLLPSGLKWVDSTLSTALSYASVNTYGGSNNLVMSGVTVPPGDSYIYVDAIGATAGNFNNQASFTVGSNTYLSDDPAQIGTANPTPVTLIANQPLADLAITKSVDKASALQNEVVKYTYIITNPNATAILTTFQDNLPASADGAMTYVASSLTGTGAAIVSPAAYGGTSSIVLRNLSIPANGSLTVTVDANTGTFTTGQTASNIASVTPEPSSGYRQITTNSNAASTTIGAVAAATGTLVCANTQMIPAPVAGTPSNHALYVTLNVTAPGVFSPVVVTGSGFTEFPSPYSINATTTGTKTYVIPVHYDGTALTNNLQFIVGSAGSCVADMTITPKVVSKNIYSLDSCTAIVPGVLTK
jgi:large repetitive protein